MHLNIPNLPLINKRDPHLSEALDAVQKFVNANVAPPGGNKVAPPPASIADPTRRPG